MGFLIQPEKGSPQRAQHFLRTVSLVNQAAVPSIYIVNHHLPQACSLSMTNDFESDSIVSKSFMSSKSEPEVHITRGRSTISCSVLAHADSESFQGVDEPIHILSVGFCTQCTHPQSNSPIHSSQGYRSIDRLSGKCKMP